MKYNFKDYESLQIDDYCCIDCLTEDIIESIYQLRKFEVVEIYAKAELIEELIARLHGLVMNDNAITFGMINFDGSGADYADVYCISINDDYTLWCEPAYRFDKENNEYKLFYSEATLAYVYQEDCGQDIIENLENCEINTLLFGFDE